MSPRIKLLRKVLNPPFIKGFKPYGPEINQDNVETINLFFEEYEAIRLCDYDMYNHVQASKLMGVSRPTFTRVYASARQKMAKAMVEGKQIAIEGGKVYFDSDWYHCKSCTCFFNNPERDIKIENCPLCSSSQIIKFDVDCDTVLKERNNMCYCPECGYEQKHVYGNPCSHLVCPKCSGLMRRKCVQNKFK